MKHLIERLEEATSEPLPDSDQKKLAGLVSGMNADMFFGQGKRLAGLASSGNEEKRIANAAAAGKSYGIVMGMYMVWSQMESMGLVKKGGASKSPYSKADSAVERIK